MIRMTRTLIRVRTIIIKHRDDDKIIFTPHRNIFFHFKILWMKAPPFKKKYFLFYGNLKPTYFISFFQHCVVPLHIIEIFFLPSLPFPLQLCIHTYQYLSISLSIYIILSLSLSLETFSVLLWQLVGWDRWTEHLPLFKNFQVCATSLFCFSFFSTFFSFGILT